MNRFVPLFLLALLPIVASDVHVREVEGLNERIVAGKLHLHVREFLELVLKNSAEIQITRLDINNAENRILAGKSPFDPALALGYTAARSLTPPFYYSLQPINNLSQQTSVGFTQLLPTGQTIASSYNLSRYSGDNYSAPALFGNLSFSLTQPLLRNRNNIEYRAPLIIARTQLSIVSELTEAAIGAGVAQDANQYWLAVLARDSIRVREQALDLARQAYERDKKALDLGAIAPLDIYQSETQLAERERDLIQARYQYKAELDALRRLIGADLTPQLRETEIVLEDDASAIPSAAVILPFEDALTKAFERRPELQAADRRLSIDDLNTRVYRQSLLPKVDLTLNGGSSGPDIFKQVAQFNYPNYGLGVQVTLPFRSSAVRANLGDSLVSKARNAYTQRQTREQVILDVRQAIDGIQLANATIDAATKARDLARKNVDAERQKYELGAVLAFEFLDSQSRLANTENSLLSAYVTYQQAYINYQRATWTLLDSLGIVIH